MYFPRWRRSIAHPSSMITLRSHAKTALLPRDFIARDYPCARARVTEPYAIITLITRDNADSRRNASSQNEMYVPHSYTYGGEIIPKYSSFQPFSHSPCRYRRAGWRAFNACLPPRPPLDRPRQGGIAAILADGFSGCR